MADVFTSHLEWTGATGPTTSVTSYSRDLFVAAKHGVAIAGYSDDADGHLTIIDGRIHMGRVTLPPRIALVLPEHEEPARMLVDEAHCQCLIAYWVQVRLDIEPTFVLAEAS